MSETFVVRSYWGDRKEEAESCADRVSRCLLGLACCDESFGRWFLKGRTQKEAVKNPISTDAPFLIDLLQRGRNRREIDQTIIDTLGFMLGFWNGAGGDHASSILFTCGAHTGNRHLLNSCLLNLPHEGKALERLLNVNVLKAVLDVVVTSWEPDWASVIPRSQTQPANFDARVPFVGWLTYLSHRRGRIPELPSHFESNIIPSHGTVILLTKEEFAVDTSLHIERARQLTRLLERAGLLVAMQ